MGQHFDFKKARKRLVVAHLRVQRFGCRRCGRTIFFAAHGQQLQARHPAIGQFVHQLGIAGIDLAQLRLEKLFGFRRSEAQIAQVQRLHLVLAA
ncbi:hypothetical protein D3C81_516730 [compost metagenome]